MSSIFLHTVVARNPFGSEVWDLTNLLTELDITNISPGGHAEASIVYEDVDPLTTPAIGALVDIRDKAGIYWTGRVEDISVDFRPGGGKVKLTCRGLASSAGDQVVSGFVNFNTVTGTASAKFDQGTAVRSAVKAIVQNLCPFLIFDDSKVHVGATLAGDSSQLYGKTAQDCFNEICSIGSDLGGGVDSADQIFWNVYSGGAFANSPEDPVLSDNFSYMELVYKDQAVSYSIDMKDCDVTEIAWQLKWIYNRITIQWEDQLGNKGTATAVDPTSKSAYPNGIGIWRDHFIDASTHVSSQYEAQLMAQSILGNVSKIRPLGKQIKIMYPEQVLDRNGQPVPLWRVLAGRVIQINGILPNNPQLMGNEFFFIRETNWNEYTRELTIMTEEVETIPQIVGKSVFQDATLPGSTVSKVIIPTKDVPTSPGADKGPGSPPTTGLIGQAAQNKGNAERNLSNIHLLVNGFENPIPDGQLGFVEISFSGHITRLTGWATKKDDPNDFSPAAETIIEIYDAARNDGGLFAHRILIGTLHIVGGFTEDIDFDYQAYRDHVLIFKKTAGDDAEIICVSARHVRDASLVETDAHGTPVSQTPSIVTHSVVGGPNNTFEVRWTTDIESTGYVSWGINTAQENQGPPDDKLAKNHFYPLPAIAPENTVSYIITVVSKDGATATTGDTFSS